MPKTKGRPEDAAEVCCFLFNSVRPAWAKDSLLPSVLRRLIFELSGIVLVKTSSLGGFRACACAWLWFATH